MKPHELLKLQDNWDSYGGKKPLPSCVAKAEELYFRLPGAWDFVPCSDGGVQLEQHINGFDIEICVSPAPVATPTADVALKHSPEFGDETKCECGHSYYRHFDTYDDMRPVGCKYCGCSLFRQTGERIFGSWQKPASTVTAAQEGP